MDRASGFYPLGWEFDSLTGHHLYKETNPWKKMKNKLSLFLEITGSFLGVLGALIMSFYPEYARFAWIIWFFSSVFLLVFAKTNNLKYLLVLQLTFIAVNLSGIYNSFI